MDWKKIFKDKRVMVAIAAATIAAIKVYSPELAEALRPIFELLVAS